MKKCILITAIVLSIGLVGCGNKTEENIINPPDAAIKSDIQSASNEIKYEIKDDFIKGTLDNVMDGDSIYINWTKEGNKNNTQFYLEGIDGPEIEHPVYKKMPFGEDSKKNLESLVSPGDEVYIEFAKDDPEALVQRAFIYIKSGDTVQQLNNEQVKVGLAYVKNDDILNQEQQEKLKETEKQAKEQKLGIWSEEDFIIDGEFNGKYVKPGQEKLLKKNNN